MCRRFALRPESKAVFSSLEGYEDGFSDEDVTQGEKALCLLKSEGTYFIRYRSFGYSFPDKVLLNARSETIRDKEIFKEDFLLRRVLVPVSGFYEYDKKKVLRYFEREDGDRFYIAGIYNRSSFVLLTGKPDLGLSYYCYRVPLVFNKRDKSLYLDYRRSISDMKEKSAVPLVERDDALVSLF